VRYITKIISEINFEEWLESEKYEKILENIVFSRIFYAMGNCEKMDLAVLHCLDASKTRIGKQPRVGVAHFFI
jgi:hypothetical protein